ncbi:hypothetical protein ACFU7Y_22400 [Kitasatospora sp. NPDC057542]|uniref:hypothetical protein n=1 Tax=Streptomycetaceae TaxID=2062 RepID=UPI001CCB93A9|nr:hypothetical protein [Streptomyces sp. LS1784]
MTYHPAAVADADWDRQLAHAFGVLIGRPLTEYDSEAVYAACVTGNYMEEIDFRTEHAWVRPAALRGEEPFVSTLYLFDEAEGTPVFDPSTSVFEFRPAGGTAEFPEGFVAAVEVACFSGHLLRGVDLAPLLERYGVDLTSPGFAGTWEVHTAVLVSDGTLLDALRAAFGTGRTPEELTPFTAEPEEEWAQELAAIPNPELRTHLGYFCTDGDTGLMPVLEDTTVHGLDDEGCEAVAGWEDGHGQAEITVIRLSDLVAGPRR